MAMELHYMVTNLTLSFDDDLPFNAHVFKELVAAGYSYEEFVEKIKAFDFPDKCNHVWVDSEIAYRCNTCALNSCKFMI